MQKNIVQNIILICLILFLTLVSSNISTDYPDFVHEIMEEPLYKVLLAGVVLYTYNLSFPIGLLLTIILFLTMADIPMVSESFNGSPVSYCPTYGSKKRIEEIGTAFYPLNDNTELQHLRGGDGSQSPAYSPELSY